MVDFADIKGDLPDWPDEVIDQWLLKLANRGADTDWPPPENLDGSGWKFILGSRPLSWWKKVTWNLEEHDLEFETMSRGTKQIICDLLDEHVNDVAKANSVGPDSKVRFLSAVRYLSKEGIFPKPLVVMRLEDGLSVLDGNHRIAGFFACQAGADEITKRGGIIPPKKQKIWVGTHAAGEVPLD